MELKEVKEILERKKDGKWLDLLKCVVEDRFVDKMLTGGEKEVIEDYQAAGTVFGKCRWIFH